MPASQCWSSASTISAAKAPMPKRSTWRLPASSRGRSRRAPRLAGESALRPLEGLKVVDFSRFLPGAYASWVAADLGADVIRIEHPRELAKHAEMFGSDADGEAAARRRARPSYTRNKRSL